MQPSREFVRHQIIDFTYDNNEPITLIYDNATQFISLDYTDYGISAHISIAAPNMNSFIESLNGTIRREAGAEYHS